MTAKVLKTARRRTVLICGPTAAGKSELALRIAERDGGVVINADAAQVYACWRVLTARPDAAELARAAHMLFGHVPCSTIYSVGAWLREIAPVLNGAKDDGVRAIVVGGTGLYFRALTEGLVEIPQIPPDVRKRSEQVLATDGPERLRADLAAHDPATLAGIDARNPMRLQRAWDVLTATGRGLSDWHRSTPAPLLTAGDCERIVIHPDKSLLNNAISARLHNMIEAGAVDEARAFRAAGHDTASPAGRVIGARALFAFIDGHIGLDAALDAAVMETRQFAKRQRTWLRGHMSDWRWLADPSSAAIPPV